MMEFKFLKNFLYLSYWNLYTDMLKKCEDEGCHIFPFSAMSVMVFAFLSGLCHLLEIFSGYFLPISFDFRLIMFLTIGAISAYFIFVKNDKFKLAKVILAGLEHMDQEEICARCGLMVVALGMSPGVLVLIVLFFFHTR